MKYQIADAKTRFFEDKQHYLNFLNAWKKAANKRELTAAHMFFYALVRGRNVYEAFTPVTRKSKLENGFYINHGMYFAYQHLWFLRKHPDHEWAQHHFDTFLAPFEGAIDKDFLVIVLDQLPELEPLFSNYGKGKKVAQLIINWKTLPNDIRLPAQLIAMEAGHRSALWSLIDIVNDDELGEIANQICDRLVKEAIGEPKTSQMGKPISRQEALVISRGTLENAENDRLVKSGVSEKKSFWRGIFS